jgi:hypothetical protein
VQLGSWLRQRRVCDGRGRRKESANGDRCGSPPRGGWGPEQRWQALRLWETRPRLGQLRSFAIMVNKRQGSDASDFTRIQPALPASDLPRWRIWTAFAGGHIAISTGYNHGQPTHRDAVGIVQQLACASRVEYWCRLHCATIEATFPIHLLARKRRSRPFGEPRHLRGPSA